MALFLSACGGGTEPDWANCVDQRTKSIEAYRKVLALAKTKVAELPAPGSDPTATANRKIIDDALAMVAGEITTFEVTVNGVRATVESALRAPNAAEAIQTGCAKLEAAGKQASERIATSSKAIQLYNELTAKAPK